MITHSTIQDMNTIRIYYAKVHLQTPNIWYNIRAMTFCDFPLFNKRQDTAVEIHLNWNQTQNQQTAMQMLLTWKPM
jgi:hypothetical protein